MTTQDLQKTENGLQFIIFKSLQFRWTEGSANPDRENEKYHLTYDEAEKAASEIKLNVGFYPVVDSIAIDIKDIDEDAEFELSELDNYREYHGDYETVGEGSTYEGENIEGSIIIEWSWEKYPGYCRNLLNIGIAGEYPFHEFKDESDLTTGNEESTFKSNYSILMNEKEVNKCDDLKEAIEEALSCSSWKWNYFKKNPSSQFICEKIKEIVNK